MMTHEMHITVEPDTSIVTYNEFVERSKELDWKASMFDHDDVDGIQGKWFLTNHAASYDAALNELKGMVHGLSCSGFEVTRAKVEHIVFDTKRGDTL